MFQVLLECTYTDQGGSLTDPTIFGIDPLNDSTPLMEERGEK